VSCLEDTVAGLVGDFNAAAASAETCIEPRFDGPLRDGSRFDLRCRNASSLCSLIRMDLFAGAISSVVEDAVDLDRV